MRKTVKVDEIISFVNRQIAEAVENQTTDGYVWYTDPISFKAGLCCAAERVLLESGTYSGFSFLHDDVTGVSDPRYYDRRYYINPKIQK